jgi:hypothetical protein
MPDIEKMTTYEWLSYRGNLIDDYYARGHRLIPNSECITCDVPNDYTCFECECDQLDKEVEAI